MSSPIHKSHTYLTSSSLPLIFINHILEKCDLKYTSLKQPRQLYSLRHYAIQTRIRKSQGKVNEFTNRTTGERVPQIIIEEESEPEYAERLAQILKSLLGTLNFFSAKLG